MIKSINIRGYRTFREFEMSQLGRVNLLVGRNNTGKSSILEGLLLLASGSNPLALWQVLGWRGEQILPDPNPNRVQQAEADISHLFFGHEIGAGTEFVLSSVNEHPESFVRYRVDLAKPEEHPQLFASLGDEGVASPRLALWISGSAGFALPPLPLSRLGSLRIETLQQFLNVRPARADSGSVQFVRTESMSVQQLGQLWTTVVLTADEERVTSALKLLEPRIERIAQVPLGFVQFPPFGFGVPSRGGFFLRLAGVEKRLPIGSFGDGMWRILSLIVSIVRAKDSILLIDEIDTGLHYTVMADMWRLINEAAVLFNVQVFASTHSYDCVHSLATICREVEDKESAITIQRIERSESKAVPFSESDILVAAQRHIEVR